MAESIEEPLSNVLKAMEDLNHRFKIAIDTLEEKGTDEEEVQSLIKGALAMKDAGALYLTWSRHFVDRLAEIEGTGPRE
ncbi:MAG: hypothetical protein ABGX83_00530 [Nitrospira sp.]|nr:hypothetical protein [Candidatus Manganitrophaceae bacterium]HIL35747.1 hypothetical protein [Candidatus Manganitrophaceae bacterium]